LRLDAQVDGIVVPTLVADARVGLPIVYINLDEATQRREAMEQALTQAGVHAVRLRAVRWSKLPASVQQRFYSRALNAQQFHVPLVDGEKGCYASHLVACEALLRSEFPALVVLEDDVTLQPSFAPVLAQLQPHLKNFDVLKLMQPGRDQLVASVELGAARIGRYARVPSFTAGQVITREGATRLLDSRMPFGRPIDIDQRHWWENHLRVRGVLPALVSLGDASVQTSIEGRDVSKRALSVRLRKLRWRAAYNLRNAWHARKAQA
jgi:glycosyl transferase, family 25